jgi:AhpD family alkylhydroperoxidase
VSEDRKRRFRFWPDGYDALHRLSEAVKASGLEPSLLELVKMRASQVNGCAYCIDMHSKDARAAGETEQRLYALSAWRETPFFTDRERAALAVTEAVTLIAGSHALSTVLDDAESHFTAEELSRLLYAVIEINAWNRLGIATGMAPGSYQPSGS